VEEGEEMRRPEKEDASRSTDLIVGENVAKLLGDVANAFDDGVEALTWVDDDRLSRAWLYHWWLPLFSLEVSR
jgi:hypothetical protein